MNKGAGFGVAIALIFAVTVYAVTNRFAAPTQNLVGSTDVVVFATAVPGIDDDITLGYLPGYGWINQGDNSAYIATDTSDGAAAWTNITAGGATFNLEEDNVLEQSNVIVLDIQTGLDAVCVAGECDIASDLGVDINTSEIVNGTILEPDLSFTNSPSDGQIATYNAAGTNFTWENQAASDGVGYDEILDESSGLTQRSQVNFIGTAVNCVDNAGATRTDCTFTDNDTLDGVGYDEILDEGSGLTQRSQVNFIGTAVNCIDNAGATRTDCTFTDNDTLDGVGYDEILDEGSGLTKRSQVNFIGAGVSCVDNAGSTRTDCTISGGGGSDPVDIEEDNVLEQTDASVIDFQSEFNVSCSAGECDVSIDNIDISDDTNLVGGTGITLTGDSLSADLGVAIDSSEITDDTVAPVDIDAVDTEADEECLTYEATGSTFEFQPCDSVSVFEYSRTILEPVDADSYLLWKLNSQITITDIHCIIDPADSAESVVIDIQETNSTGDSGVTFDATITCDNDGAEDDGSLTNGVFDANDWVLWDIGTVTGTVSAVTVTIYYTY